MPQSSLAARAPFHQPGAPAAAAVPALCIDGSGDGSVNVATGHLLRKDAEKTRRGVSSAVPGGMM
jgi:hypothetical protein